MGTAAGGPGRIPILRDDSVGYVAPRIIAPTPGSGPASFDCHYTKTSTPQPPPPRKSPPEVRLRRRRPPKAKRGRSEVRASSVIRGGRNGHVARLWSLSPPALSDFLTTSSPFRKRKTSVWAAPVCELPEEDPQPISLSVPAEGAKRKGEGGKKKASASGGQAPARSGDQGSAALSDQCESVSNCPRPPDPGPRAAELNPVDPVNPVEKTPRPASGAWPARIRPVSGYMLPHRA